MAKTGRPQRKDNPKRLTILLSSKSLRTLNRLSVDSSSRGLYLEELIENAAKLREAA